MLIFKCYYFLVFISLEYRGQNQNHFCDLCCNFHLPGFNHHEQSVHSLSGKWLPTGNYCHSSCLYYIKREISHLFLQCFWVLYKVLEPLHLFLWVSVFLETRFTEDRITLKQHEILSPQPDNAKVKKGIGKNLFFYNELQKANYK